MREGRRCCQPRRLHRPRGELGRVHIFPPQVGTTSVSRRPQRLAGAAAPVHVLFLKEVPRLSETSETKARQEPGLLGECPRHLK